jgi:hypothetical protein
MQAPALYFKFEFSEISDFPITNVFEMGGAQTVGCISWAISDYHRYTKLSFNEHLGGFSFGIPKVAQNRVWDLNLVQSIILRNVGPCDRFESS